MLTAPPPSPNVSSPNYQGTQLLANPNARQIQGIQQYARMGRQMPGGLSVPGTSANWPVGGMSMGMPELSQNPMQNPNMVAMMAALRGQR